MTNRYPDILNTALARFQDLTGATADFKGVNKPADKDIDGEIDIHVRGQKLHFYVEVKTEYKPYYLARTLETANRFNPLLIVTERIYPADRKALQEKQIAYLDIAGNMFIHQGTVLFLVDGNKTPDTDKPTTNRAFTKAGLRAVFYLLQDENLINMPYRVLARATGNALGTIKYIIEGLSAADFILPVNKTRKALKNKKALLERWITGYHEVLKPALHMADYTFRNPDHFIQWHTLPGNVPLAWGGEAAAELLTGYLNPGILTLYLNDRLPVLMDWKLAPARNGNVKLYEKFWTNTAWDERQLAPPLLVYADLRGTNDPRCMEAAAMIYEKYLKNEFE